MAVSGRRRSRAAEDVGRSGEQEPVDAVRVWLESGAWTEDLYFALPETNSIIELADGKLIIPDMPTRAHQRVVLALGSELRSWNRETRAGEVVIAPYPVRLGEGTIREPDVVFYLAEHLDRMAEQHGGSPDLVVEVLSPSTRAADLNQKHHEYAAAGVREYWIVDPEERWIDVYRLTGDRYELTRRYRSGETTASHLLAGFAVEVDSLFAA